MLKAVAWGVGLAVVNIAVNTVMSKTLNAKAKATEAEYEKYLKEFTQKEGM